jgi:hypothetical protein
MAASVIKSRGPKAIWDASCRKDAYQLAREKAASHASVGGNPLPADRAGKIAANLAYFLATVESDLSQEEIHDTLHEPGDARMPWSRRTV